MVAKVFRLGVSYSNVVDSHCVTLLVLNTKVETLVIRVREVVGRVIEVCDELAEDILRVVL